MADRIYDEIDRKIHEFHVELTALVNKHCMDNFTNIPDDLLSWMFCSMIYNLRATLVQRKQRNIFLDDFDEAGEKLESQENKEKNNE